MLSCPEGTVKQEYEKAAADAVTKSASKGLSSDIQITNVQANITSCTAGSATRMLFKGFVHRSLTFAVTTELDIQTTRFCGFSCDLSDSDSMLQELANAQAAITTDINNGSFATEVGAVVKESDSRFQLAVEPIEESTFS